MCVCVKIMLPDSNVCAQECIFIHTLPIHQHCVVVLHSRFTWCHSELNASSKRTSTAYCSIAPSTLTRSARLPFCTWKSSPSLNCLFLTPACHFFCKSQPFLPQFILICNIELSSLVLPESMCRMVNPDNKVPGFQSTTQLLPLIKPSLFSPIKCTI